MITSTEQIVDKTRQNISAYKSDWQKNPRYIQPRFAWVPYVLWAYFDVKLLIVESRKKVTHDIRVFFMDHSGNIKAEYTINK